MSQPLAHRQGRILWTLLGLLLAVGVVPLVATSWSLVTRSRQSLEFSQRDIQQSKARSLSQQVALYVQGIGRQVRAIAQTLEVDLPVAGKPKVRDSKVLERYVGEDSPLLSLSVVDSGGQGVQAGFQLQDQPIQLMLEEGYYRGRQGKGMVSNPLVSESMKEPVIVISEPIRSAEGKPGGVVLAVASLLPLWQQTKAMADNRDLEVYIVDGRGRLIAHSDEKRELGADLSSVEIVSRFIKDPRGVGAVTQPFRLTEPGGASVEMVGTFSRVPDGSGLGVFVQIPTDKAYLAADEMRRQSLALVGVVTGLAIVLGFLFAGRITQPIRALAQGARRLASGDYGTRVEITSENEVGLLADAFNYMGSEIKKAIDQIREAAATNKELFMGSIRMLANAIDEKDPYTRGHSERVAYYSACLAKHMGMPPEEVERVHLSGLIHDVGKIGIEDAILRKASALTDDEYAIMKQHPRKGLHILEAVPRLKEMAGAGLMHHENVDGTGYPEGLQGTDIPLLGRMVCVADAFDAMTTDRPYSKAMTFEAAIARLRFLAGKKFDAEAVEAFARAHDAGEISPAKARAAAAATRAPGTPPEAITSLPSPQTITAA